LFQVILLSILSFGLPKSTTSKWTQTENQWQNSITSSDEDLARQYQAQDNSGQIAFGYSHPGQAHSVLRDSQGNVKGSYAYVDPDGNHVQVNYVADSNGFRVLDNNMPQHSVTVSDANDQILLQVEDTLEVKEAKRQHFAAVAAARDRAAQKKSFEEDNFENNFHSSEPSVEDLPEVKVAKAEYIAAINAAKARTTRPRNSFRRPAVSRTFFSFPHSEEIEEVKASHFPVLSKATPRLNTIFNEIFTRNSFISNANTDSQNFPADTSFIATDLTGSPLPVEDTPEVKAAKLEHFAAVAAAKARNLAVNDFIRNKRAVFSRSTDNELVFPRPNSFFRTAPAQSVPVLIL